MKFKFIIIKNDDIIYTGDHLIEGAIIQGLYNTLGDSITLEEYLDRANLVMNGYLKSEGDFSLFDFVDYVALNYGKIKTWSIYSILSDFFDNHPEGENDGE